MTEHVLKCWPQFFAAIVSEKKRFEVRLNDRNFAVGDVLIIREFDPHQPPYGKFTGPFCERRVDYILANAEAFGIMDGYVVMSLSAPEPPHE